MLFPKTRRKPRPLVQSDNKQDVPDTATRTKGDTERNGESNSKRIGGGFVIHSLTKTNKNTTS